MINKVINRFFKRYTRNNKLVLFYAILFSVIQPLLLLPSVYFIKIIFDNNIPHSDLNGLLVNSAYILSLTLFQSLLTIVHRNAFLRIVKNAVKTLQQDILRGLIWAQRKLYDDADQANIANRSVSDVDLVDKMIDAILSVVIPQVVLFIIGVVIMIIYNPVIGFSTLLLGVVGVLVQRVIRKGILESIRNHNDAKDKMTSYVNFLSPKQVLVKMRNNEGREFAGATTFSDHLINAGTDAAKKGSKIKVADELIVNLAATVLIVLGSIQILMGSASYGNIFGLYFLIVFIRRTVTNVQSNTPTIQEGIVSLERIFKLLDRFQSDTFAEGRQIEFKGNVELKDVSFGYNDELILDKINFKIDQGEVVAITGYNGAGKSSLINLLLGFYKPISGDIMYEGHSYADINAGALRTNIGYVPQQQILISGTIAENIAYGLSHTEASIEKLKQKMIYKELMSGFKDGLDTIVSEGGKHLSNGQVQRISILRALASDPKLIILDEPTNHLDGASIVSLVTEVKSKLGISVIIISHHALFTEFTDSAYVLEGGKLKRVV